MSDAETTATTPRMFECIIPILRVENLQAGLDFYVRMLGFSIDWQYLNVGGISRDGCNLYLCEGAQGQPRTWVWMGVEDVEPLYADLRAKDARIIQGPTNYPWGLEIRVEDPDGHVLRIASEPRADLPFETPV